MTSTSIRKSPQKSLTWDSLMMAVTQLVPPLAFQGHEPYCDNYYSSVVIMSNATFHTSRHGLQSEVLSLKNALTKGKVPLGTGHNRGTDIVYCMWKDTCAVSVMSTCHPRRAPK